MINNPWIEISDESRVLSIDIEQVEHYNGRRSDNPICSEDFPEPFLGRKSAEIYLLLGNPGFDPTKDVHSYSDDQKNAVLRNLRHQNENEDYPHYLLSAKFDNHPGYAWWHAVFQPLMKELSLEKATIAKSFFCMELIGYHTESGDEKITRVLPSVEYSKFLLTEAIRESKTIIVGRGITKWLGIFPSLLNYDNCFFLASNRGVSLSKSTISPTAYKNIIKAVNSK